MTSKVNTSNPKNQVFENYSNKVNTLIDKRAQQVFKDKTFGDEYRGIYGVVTLLKITCSLCSAVTVFVAVNWAIAPIVGVAAPIISLLICILLEFLKGLVWGKLTKVTLKYKQRAILLGAAALGLNLISTGGSVFGAFQLPMMIQPNEQKAVALIDTDSIAMSYDSEFIALDAAIRGAWVEVEKTTSNSTKRALSKNVDKQSEQRKALTITRDKAVSRAILTNENNAEISQNEYSSYLENHSKKVSSNQKNCIAFAILFELILILCLMFDAYYLFRCEIDRTGGFVEGVAVTVTQNVLSENEAVLLPPVDVDKTPTVPLINSEQRRKIGFGTQSGLSSLVNGEVKTLETIAPQITQTEYDNAKRVGVCAFVGCRQPFEYSNDSKKYCGDLCKGRAYRLRAKENG